MGRSLCTPAAPPPVSGSHGRARQATAHVPLAWLPGHPLLVKPRVARSEGSHVQPCRGPSWQLCSPSGRCSLHSGGIAPPCLPQPGPDRAGPGPQPQRPCPRGQHPPRLGWAPFPTGPIPVPLTSLEGSFWRRPGRGLPWRSPWNRSGAAHAEPWKVTVRPKGPENCRSLVGYSRATLWLSLVLGVIFASWNFCCGVINTTHGICHLGHC